MIETATKRENIMMAVHVMTQCRENYGAHDWDGVGQCPQYWKPKFGDDYIIRNAPSCKAAEEYVQAQFGRDDEYYREHVTFSSTDTNSLPEWKTPIEIEWADRHNEFGIALAEATANEAREELFDHYANV